MYTFCPEFVQEYFTGVCTELPSDSSIPEEIIRDFRVLPLKILSFSTLALN